MHEKPVDKLCRIKTTCERRKAVKNGYVRRLCEVTAVTAAEADAGESESDFDWGSKGLSWNERGDIVEKDGTVLHEVAPGFLSQPVSD